MTKALLICTAVLRTSMMKELEIGAPMTEAKKNRTAILSVSERGAKLGQRIKSLVAPHADCFEKKTVPLVERLFILIPLKIILDRFSRIMTKYYVLWRLAS